MKITKRSKYSVELYEETNVKTDHKKTPLPPLHFTGPELIHAIISAGMPDTYLTRKQKKARASEMFFKINLAKTFLISDSQGYLSFDVSRKDYLDSTEIGAINYWIGMMMITVLAKKNYGYDYLVHLSKLNQFSKTISPNILPHVTPTGSIAYKSPDLIAIKIREKEYGVFESKGYSKYDANAMEQGYEQAKSIASINGVKPKNALVVMTQTGSKYIKMIQKDPEGDKDHYSIDPRCAHLYHFLPIAELIAELGPEAREGRMYASFNLSDETYSISLPLNLYNLLTRIAENENITNAKEALVSYFQKENIDDLLMNQSDIFLVE